MSYLISLPHYYFISSYLCLLFPLCLSSNPPAQPHWLATKLHQANTLHKLIPAEQSTASTRLQLARQQGDWQEIDIIRQEQRLRATHFLEEDGRYVMLEEQELRNYFIWAVHNGNIPALQWLCRQSAVWGIKRLYAYKLACAEKLSPTDEKVLRFLLMAGGVDARELQPLTEEQLHRLSQLTHISLLSYLQHLLKDSTIT